VEDRHGIVGRKVMDFTTLAKLVHSLSRKKRRTDDEQALYFAGAAYLTMHVRAAHIRDKRRLREEEGITEDELEGYCPEEQR
jgi:hypothetical protein